MPIVVRYEAGQLRAAVTRLGREIDAVLATDFTGALYQILPLSQFEQDRSRARVVARQGGVGGPVTTRESDVRLAPAGPTEVDLR
jgi:hypothetical protein